ncbi:hypothetical protein E4T39_08364 [Aureobasidium subglaciale]|nr:hypothetical protein E4T39_08364 [Aureobasidium subglaciale]
MNSSIHRNPAALLPSLPPPSTPALVLTPQITTYHTPSAPVLTHHVTAYPTPPAVSCLPPLLSLPLVRLEAATNPPTFVAPSPARPLRITSPPLPAPVTLWVPPTSTTTEFQRSNVNPPPISISAIPPAPPVQPKLPIATATSFQLSNITPPPTPVPAVTVGAFVSPPSPVAELVTARPAGPAPIPLPVSGSFDVSVSTIVPGPTAQNLLRVSVIMPPLDIISGPVVETIPLPIVVPDSTIVSGPTVDTVPHVPIVEPTSVVAFDPIVDTTPYIPMIFELTLCEGYTQTEDSQSISRTHRTS